MPNFFLKELPDRPIFLPSGAPVPFESIGRDIGILRTEDPYLIGELQKAIDRHIGGVIAISESDYNDWLQKKSALISQLNSPRDRQSLGALPRGSMLEAAGVVGGVPVSPFSPLVASPNQQPRVTHAEPQKVAPLDVPKVFTPPKVGKLPPTS